MARRLIVDGMNVIGSRPTGWWRDRRGAMSELTEVLARHAAETGDEVAVVLDSKPFSLADETRRHRRALRIRARAGRRGRRDRGHGRRRSRAGTLAVATSDRRLAARVRMLGAETITAGALRRTLDQEERD